MMIKNEIISITLASLVAMVCLFVVAAPVSADITIYPHTSLSGESPEYIFVLDYSGDCDMYFVNVTIPKGYTANDTIECNCSVIILTLQDSKGNIISRSTASKNANAYWVNVTGTDYDGVYGPFDANCSTGEVTEICTEYTACLSLTMPNASANGSINISLGALGPLASGDRMTFEFARGCIKNPVTCGCYEWSVTATDDQCSYSDSDVVCIIDLCEYYDMTVNGGNNNGITDIYEAWNAIQDYLADNITVYDAWDVIQCYLADF